MPQERTRIWLGAGPQGGLSGGAMLSIFDATMAHDYVAGVWVARMLSDAEADAKGFAEMDGAFDYLRERGAKCIEVLC
jgi:hypothetical protein